jgi:AcrR family transcriptional regulator
MTAPKPSSARLTPRQEEIVQAAMAVVQEEGWANLTVRRLAERLGVTDPALYRHFQGKRELALAIAGRLQRLLLEPVRGIAAETAVPVRLRVERILRHHLDLVLATGGLPVLLIAEASTGDARLAERLRGIMDEYARLLGGLLAELEPPPGADGETAAPEELVLQLIALPAAVALRCRLFPDRKPEPERLRWLMSRHVDRVLALPDAAEPAAGEEEIA